MEKVQISAISKWLFFGILIGLVAGLGAWVFMLLLKGFQHIFAEKMLYHMAPATAHMTGEVFTLLGVKWWWLIPLIPAVGGLISGLLVFIWAPEAEGHGTDGVIASFHHGRGMIRSRVPLIKTLASAALIGSGGSAGREGPIAQIGAGFGSFLGRVMNVTVKDRRLMVLAGAAAGISAIFQAPLGGAIFITEVLYRNHELETEALIPAIIASLTAYSVYTRLVGRELLFSIPPALRFEKAEELIAYLLLGLVCSVVGIFYVKVFYGMRDHFFKRIKMPLVLKPALGGFLLGLLLLVLPHVWGGGYDVMQLAMAQKMGAVLMLLLVVGKILATSFSISSGGSGGVFAPSLFIGAMLGGGIGALFHQWLPASFMPDPTAMVVVGMGGFFAGIAKVPIASIIMVSEMTGGYGLLVPMMLVSTITVLFTRHYSLYEKQVAHTIDSPAHKGDFITDLLAGLTVADTQALLAQPVTLKATDPLSSIFRVFSERKQNFVPVVDQENMVQGIVYFDDLRDILFENELDLKLIIAADVAKTEFPYITPQENLHNVITKFALHKINELPVLMEEHGQLKGMLTEQEVILTYNKKLEAMKATEIELMASRGGFI